MWATCGDVVGNHEVGNLERVVASHLAGQTILLYLTHLSFLTYVVLAGNHPRFKELCTSLSLPPPTAKFNQTYKTVYAISKLGPKRCQKCGLKTTRRPVVDNVVICRYCQPIVAFTKTQAKVRILSCVTVVAFVHAD